MESTKKYSFIAIIGALIAVGVSQLTISDFISGIVLGADIVIMLFAIYKIAANASAAKAQAESQQNEN